ncbi:MAG: hypothetical protein ACTSW7_00755 [Candidatus Thorarchaeota archaeon]|nr:hypothetical protein [Thermoplasmatales archaeon]
MEVGVSKDGVVTVLHKGYVHCYASCTNCGALAPKDQVTGTGPGDVKIEHYVCSDCVRKFPSVFDIISNGDCRGNFLEGSEVCEVKCLMRQECVYLTVHSNAPRD